MPMLNHLRKSPAVQPEIRFGAGHGLILIAGDAEHRVFNPTLEAMLQREKDCSESRSSTRKWIQEPSEYSPFSFAALCEYLDLDSDWLRRGLTRWMDGVDQQSTDQSFKTRMPHISPLLLDRKFPSRSVGKRRGVNRCLCLISLPNAE
jgi:hypothetical protein